MAKLAELLLRRKELNEKVKRLTPIRDGDVFSIVVNRRMKITETLDDLSAKFPKLELNQVTQEYDHYARQLRQVDAAIQKANWETEVTVSTNVMRDFTPAENTKAAS